MQKQRMFNGINVNKLVFFDIETVMIKEKFEYLSDRKKDLWMFKCEKINPKQPDILPDVWYQQMWEEHAALFAEFAQVICVSLGYYVDGKLKTNTYVNDNEDMLLSKVSEKLNETIMDNKALCGYNIVNFDIPMLTKRFLINGIDIPLKLWTYGMKPWETTQVDIFNIWKFGSFSVNTISTLDMVADAFDIPSSKSEEINGKNVYKMFYGNDPEKNKKIAKYCCNDVIVTSNVLNAMIGDPLRNPLIE